MQVAGSVNSRYYAQYHSSSSVKKSADTSALEGNYVSNETVGYQRSVETVDYQEYYKAWMSQGSARAIEYATGNADVYSMEQTGAVSIAETEDEGEILGLTMVPEEGQSVTYGMRAMISDKSTPDNPIVQVVSNLGGKKVIYNVEVNKVNPNNATQLEMFALLSYTDKMGITDRGTFGSHQQLEVYGGNASSIGYCGSFSGADVFLNERFDWTSIMEKMVQVYKDAGIENQAEDCKALFDFFATYTENNEVKDNTAIDFSRFAPNAPEEVKQAFMEAAEETGYNEGERMDYLSQVFIHQVENRQNGVADYTDVFGSSIASALQAAKEMLYDLENPLMPISQRGENAAKYVEQEKAFYRAFIEKLEMMEDKSVSRREEGNRQSSKVPEEYAGMSFWDLINSGKGNTISTVDKIVNAKNPEDGKIYLTFFTKGNITCYEPNGEKVWELEIANEEKRSLIEDFFENYTPDRGYVKEYYSDESLGRVSSKEFWEGYLTNASVVEASEKVQKQAESSLDEISDYSEYIKKKINEIFLKIQNGDTEPTYQIGSQSFTEKEWETFLEKFDSIEEAIQELIKEEQAKKEAEETNRENELAGTVSAGNGIPGNHGLETWYQGEKVEWSANDAKYTDPETGISYYVKDGKHPYMTAEDTEKLKELCQETGEPWLKKFAEITGMIQQLDDNTTAFVGSNGTLIKSKDGKELFIDTSSLTYDTIMSLFKDLPSNGNYFDSSFWEERIRATEVENVSAIDDGALLTAETTSCKYETADLDDDDIVYVTFYTTDGIRCKKLGAEDFEWTLTFENEEQYNKVMEFLGNFPSDWNMRFAAHENFWQDFLNDEIDMEGFMEFMSGTNKGVPDYSITVGDSMYIDKDKMQWAKYTNPLGARFYTAEEMHQMQVEIIAANEAKLTKFTDWDAYEEMYKKNHPEYNGEKICCEYPGGPLYTVKEMAELQYRKMLERMGTTEEQEQQKREEWRKQMGYPGY